jgi:hypothetical protein
MKSNANKRLRPTLSRIGQVAVVVLVTCMSSYCTSPDKQTKIAKLSADEHYLVEMYVRAAGARDLHAISPLKSDSLFTRLDSTIDSTRIANTIRALNEDPDRWLLIFENIELDLARPQGSTNPPRPGDEAQESQGRESEESGR